MSATVGAPDTAAELISRHVAGLPRRSGCGPDVPDCTRFPTHRRGQPETSSSTLFFVSGPSTSTMIAPRRKNTAAMANAAPAP
jgi:hypothetical protein